MPGAPTPAHIDPVAFAIETAMFGVGGWALENAFFGPRYSVVFRGAKVPFLPVYAVGGAAILLTRPHLQKIPWILRVPIYTVLLSGIEFAGCQIDRKLLGACSWDYTNAGCTNAMEGCIDLGHGLLWGALGVAVEGISWVADRIAQHYNHRSEAALKWHRRARNSNRNRRVLALM